MDARAPKERLRRRKDKKKKKKKVAAAEPPLTRPASIHDVTDDLLKLILLRLDSPLWLIHAAATCKLWRGIIAGDDFLALSRTLHPPAVVGQYLERNPSAFVPSPSLPAAGGGSGRFSSLDFLPRDKAAWEVADCHGGLILLRERGRSVPDLVVCDPVARQYQGIICPKFGYFYRFAGAYLLDGDANGGGDTFISMSNFRVLYTSYIGPRACVFSTSEGGDWRLLDTLGKDKDLDGFTMERFVGRLDGAPCISLQADRMMAFDKTRLQFSKVDLPSRKDPSAPDVDDSSFLVVHSSGEGTAPAIKRVVHLYGDELEVFRRVQGRWVLEHSVLHLSKATRGLPGYPEKRFDWKVEIVDGGLGFVVFLVMEFGRRWLFSVDVGTMKMAVVPERTFRGVTCPYTLPWPPLLKACVGQSRRRRR